MPHKQTAKRRGRRNTWTHPTHYTHSRQPTTTHKQMRHLGKSNLPSWNPLTERQLQGGESQGKDRLKKGPQNRNKRARDTHALTHVLEQPISTPECSPARWLGASAPVRHGCLGSRAPTLCFYSKPFAECSRALVYFTKQSPNFVFQSHSTAVKRKMYGGERSRFLACDTGGL